MVVNGHRAPAPLRAGKQLLTIYCDRTGLEIFASDGLCYAPIPFIPKSGDQTVSLSSTGGEAKVVSLAVHELGSAWVTQLEANQHKLGQ